jgi:4-oxalocrotonate tautomerase
MWPGRSAEQKEQIIIEVTEALARTSGAPPEAVTVILHEIPKTDWGHAGQPFSRTHPDP